MKVRFLKYRPGSYPATKNISDMNIFNQISLVTCNYFLERERERCAGVFCLARI